LVPPTAQEEEEEAKAAVGLVDWSRERKLDRAWTVRNSS